MELNLNKARVEGMTKVCAVVLANEFRDAHPIEILVAFSQMIGRLIVAQEGTTILHNDMAMLAVKQIHEAIIAGYNHHGRNPEGLL
jgi:hypothetical protein